LLVHSIDVSLTQRWLLNSVPPAFAIGPQSEQTPQLG
jgi:hypothetical protein